MIRKKKRKNERKKKKKKPEERFSQHGPSFPITEKCQRSVDTKKWKREQRSHRRRGASGVPGQHLERQTCIGRTAGSGEGRKGRGGVRLTSQARETDEEREGDVRIGREKSERERGC